MITFNRTRKDGALQVVEKSEDILPRLGRLEADNSEMMRQLVQLEKGQLERLADLTEDALERQHGNNGQARNSRPSPLLAPRLPTVFLLSSDRKKTRGLLRN